MKKIVLIAAALGVLVAAGAAYAAAVNSYQATLSFSSKKAGTPAKPAPVGYLQNIKATGLNGNRTAVLTDILTKIYGLKADGKDFPTCSAAKISGCQVTTPAVRRARWSPPAPSRRPSVQRTTSPPPARPCNPLLHVWNGGQGKLTFFFVDQAPNASVPERCAEDRPGRRRIRPPTRPRASTWSSTSRSPST